VPHGQAAYYIYSVAIETIAEEFEVGEVVSTLGLTLFLFDFGLSPVLWAPISEAYGRKVAVLPLYFVAPCFCFGTAVSKDRRISRLC
jgi:MFS family permease